jgi:tetratricopeptide (TPR) repeat protein
MKVRSAWAVVGLLGLALYGWLAVHLYRAKADPERSEGRDPYHEELRQAENLLVRSLRSQPTQARALARLAAVRWELEQPVSEQTRLRTAETIALASAMAPTDPRVQLQLGELLLKMGRRDEATLYLHRAASLNLESSDEVVSLMRDHLFGAGEILDLLPPRSEVFAALQQAFVEDGLEARYVDAVETSLVTPIHITPRLLSAYGNVCLRIGAATRLRDRMDLLGPLEDAEAEAERLRQRSRAHLALRDPLSAIADARQARDRRPSLPYAEHLGDTLLSAGSESEAVLAFRDALGIVASGSGKVGTRARLYRKIGQAEEQQGRVDKAYDAYKLALQLNPEEPFAKRRIRQMEEAAGQSRPSG